MLTKKSVAILSGWPTYDRSKAGEQAGLANISVKSATCFNLAHFKHAFTNRWHHRG
jgi:hypothetical protein